MAAETNLIKKADLARVRLIDFTLMFSESLRKLTEALGVTRKIAKQAGTVLKTYKATGTLESGTVDEGEIVPLSKYKTEAVSYGEIIPEKWRKATSLEAIVDGGYDQAVTMTNNRMLKDVQNKIRTKFFTFIATGTGTASGVGLQAALAAAWGKLQVLFEDSEIDAVYFLNPLDVAEYLGVAPITMQTAFGMSYIENFLGLGRVFLTSSVTKGKLYATAANNIVLYYIPVNGADLGEGFNFASDQLGLIGIHEKPNYDNFTIIDSVVCGVTLFAERLDGIVVGTIAAPSTSGGTSGSGSGGGTGT